MPSPVYLCVEFAEKILIFAILEGWPLQLEKLIPVLFYDYIYISLAVAEIGDHLTAIDMGRKVGAAVGGGSWIAI